MIAGRRVSQDLASRRPLAALRRFSIGGRVSLTICLLLVLIIAIPGAWSHYNPDTMSPGEIYQAPSTKHWFGTDQYGRDIFSRIIYGSRESMSLGVVAVCLSLAISLPLGIAVGYYRGRLDAILMRLVDIMMAFPGILLALLVIAILGPGLVNAMVAVGIGESPAYTRIVRASTIAVRGQSYIEASLAMGARGRRILLRHILPNVIQPVMVIATVGFASAVIIGSSLGFLGLGAQPPTAEWGTMISEGRAYLRTQWWISTFPGATLAITVLTFNILGDALRDILDPRLRR